MKEIQKVAADTTGISKLDLKRQNRMYILRCLRNNGSACRVDLAEEIGLTKAAVTIIVNEMIDDGVLLEKGEQPPSGEGKAARGRKKILVDYNETFRLVLGLLVDADQITLGLCTLKGRTVEKQTCSVPEDGKMASFIGEVRRMYDELCYKNSLRPEMLAGLGVCLSREYYGLTGVGVDERGEPDYSALQNELGSFCSLPMIFGTVAEGAAVAEVDFQPGGELPPVNAVVLRTDRDLDTAVVICRELYRGSCGRPASVLEMSGSPVCKILPENLRERLQQNGNQASTNFVREMYRDKVSDPLELFSKASFRPLDPYYKEILQETEDAYFWMYDLLLRAYAPDRLVLIGEGGVERAIEGALRRANRQFPQCPNGIVRRSILRETDLFKGAAALAVREFFIDRGGL